MIIDVSNWEVLSIDESGQRRKEWLKNSDDTRYLFKVSYQDENYSEYLATKIGEIFGIAVVDTYLATKDHVLGTISLDFNQGNLGAIFHEAVDFFEKKIIGFDDQNLLDYTLDLALEITSEANLVEEFITMCVFDFLIANQDRHVQNWGIIEKENCQIFAPLYDNGSSLGVTKSEEDIKKMFSDQRMFTAFTAKSRTIFTINAHKRPKYQELLQELQNRYQNIFKNVVNQLLEVDFDQKLTKLLTNSDLNNFSEIKKKFIRKLLNYRLEIIKKMLGNSQ